MKRIGQKLHRTALAVFVVGVLLGAHSPMTSAAGNTSASPEEHHSRHRAMPSFLQVCAQVLKMDRGDLWKQLQGGRSLFEIASAKGMSHAEFVRQVVEIEQKKIDTAVENGTLTREDAIRIKADLPRRIERIGAVKGWGKQSGRSNYPFFEHVATLLHMDRPALMNELKSGKSVAEVATAKGVAVKDIESKLQQLVKDDLEIKRKQGQLTMQQVQQITHDLPDRIHRWVTYKGWFQRKSDKVVQSQPARDRGTPVHPVSDTWMSSLNR